MAISNPIPVAQPWPAAPRTPIAPAGNSHMPALLPIYAKGDRVTLLCVPFVHRRLVLNQAQEAQISYCLKIDPYQDYEVLGYALYTDGNGNAYVAYYLGGLHYAMPDEVLAPMIAVAQGWQQPTAMPPPAPSMPPPAPSMPPPAPSMQVPIVGEWVAPVVPPAAEITKGRFISDAERSLIETRIALRKKLHGG